MNYGEYLWSDYIVDLNARRQREGIYEPLSYTVDHVKALMSRDFWARGLPAAVRKAAEDGTLPYLGAWLAALLICALTLAVLLFRRLLRFLPWPGSRWHGRRSKRSQRPAAASVGFYRRLETLLRSHGMHRPPAQTQREFAMAVGGQLAERPNHATVAEIPRRLVDRFYRVRYGGALLEVEETEEIERSLQQLATALKVRS